MGRFAENKIGNECNDDQFCDRVIFVSPDRVTKKLFYKKKQNDQLLKNMSNAVAN